MAAQRVKVPLVGPFPAGRRSALDRAVDTPREPMRTAVPRSTEAAIPISSLDRTASVRNNKEASAAGVPAARRKELDG